MLNKKQFGEKTTALEVVEGINLKGKDVIVTGGAGGIGVETVRALAKTGARVVIAARDLIKAEEVADEIRKDTNNNDVEVEHLELDSLKSVRMFVSRYLAKNRPLHILINNAGIFSTPFGKTVDGFEQQFGVNHIGHFELTVGLLPALKVAKNARVVVLSSVAHILSPVIFDDIHFENRPYDETLSYCQSKTANMLFAVELTKRYAADGITANAVMPGGILTGIQKHVPREEMIKRGWMDENGKPNADFKNTEEGAATSVWGAVAQELEGHGGLYLEDCQVKSEVSMEDVQQALKIGFKNGYPKGYLAYAVDHDNAKKLWEISEKLVASVL